jgi:hypothetical protein
MRDGGDLNPAPVLLCGLYMKSQYVKPFWRTSMAMFHTCIGGTGTIPEEFKMRSESRTFGINLSVPVALFG